MHHKALMAGVGVTAVLLLARILSAPETHAGSPISTIPTAIVQATRSIEVIEHASASPQPTATTVTLKQAATQVTIPAVLSGPANPLATQTISIVPVVAETAGSEATPAPAAAPQAVAFTTAIDDRSPCAGLPSGPKVRWQGCYPMRPMWVPGATARAPKTKTG